MTVVFQGTFDPFTNGHLAVLKQALHLFGQVHILILVNPDKKPLFSVQERIELIQQATTGLSGVSVDSSEGLLVDYMRPRGWTVCVRGVRNAVDADYELKNHHLSQRLYPTLQTLYFPCREAESQISSSAVKDLVQKRLLPANWVSPTIEQSLLRKLSSSINKDF